MSVSWPLKAPGSWPAHAPVSHACRLEVGKANVLWEARVRMAFDLA